MRHTARPRGSPGRRACRDAAPDRRACRDAAPGRRACRDAARCPQSEPPPAPRSSSLPRRRKMPTVRTTTSSSPVKASIGLRRPSILEPSKDALRLHPRVSRRFLLRRKFMGPQLPGRYAQRRSWVGVHASSRSQTGQAGLGCGLRPNRGRLRTGEADPGLGPSEATGADRRPGRRPAQPVSFEVVESRLSRRRARGRRACRDVGRSAPRSPHLGKLDDRASRNTCAQVTTSRQAR
ncbi:MAG: hypothetical protein JWQ32_1151 [Marmoricola sp.]|nr:hypothetical protein [Marmoricola sp.]